MIPSLRLILYRPTHLSRQRLGSKPTFDRARALAAVGVQAAGGGKYHEASSSFLTDAFFMYAVSDPLVGRGVNHLNLTYAEIGCLLTTAAESGSNLASATTMPLSASMASRIERCSANPPVSRRRWLKSSIS